MTIFMDINNLYDQEIEVLNKNLRLKKINNEFSWNFQITNMSISRELPINHYKLVTTQCGNENNRCYLINHLP